MKGNTLATTPQATKLLAELEVALPKLIQSTARSIAPAEPIYAVIVCYSDNTSAEFMPSVIVSPEAVRQWAKKYGAVDYDIWKPQVELSSDGSFKRDWLKHPAVQKKIVTCYDILTEPGNQDDSVLLLPFREMLWRVARNLNQQDWKAILQPTDDFVVIVSDESGFTVEEDARESLPEQKRLLLESRGLFFTPYKEDERDAETRRIREELASHLTTFTPQEQVAFLINQLDLIGRDQDGAVAETWVILQKLQDLGKMAVLPMLDLAQKLSHLPQRQGKQPSAAAVLLPGVMDSMARIGDKSLIVERRLRGLLEESVEINSSLEKWNRMPFQCAQALRTLFDYPWPTQGWEHNQLCRIEEYLDVPYKSAE